MSFKVKFESVSDFVAEFSEKEQHTAEFSQHIEVPVADYYDGEYEIEPTDEAQIIPLVGKTMRKNFVVKAVPQNYGFVTWDGSRLTIS